MPIRLIGFILLVSTIGFITVGDLVLPRPLSTYSRGTREQINRWMIAALPKPTPERPSKKREAQREEFLRRADPSTAKP
ncbi:hypothetical protein V0288_24285 [Pannus brasiliensis CCIBt3594]|uniref:Uncharacterized protein n=1 Tax=Pannus brasiliensis CCIBt3594 TaxID=1427578 RepID=A0AAW9R0Y0_9CHRO